jgi:hypothetical protein
MRNGQLASAIKANYAIAAEFDEFFTQDADSDESIFIRVAEYLQEDDGVFKSSFGFSASDLNAIFHGTCTPAMLSVICEAIENDYLDIESLRDEYQPDPYHNEDDDDEEYFEVDDFDLKGDVMAHITNSPEGLAEFVCKFNVKIKQIAAYDFFTHLNVESILGPLSYSCDNGTATHTLSYKIRGCELPLSVSYEQNSPLNNTSYDIKLHVQDITLVSDFELQGGHDNDNEDEDDDGRSLDHLNIATDKVLNNSGNGYTFNQGSREIYMHSFKSALDERVVKGVFNEYYQRILNDSQEYGHSLFNKHSELIEFVDLIKSAKALTADFGDYLSQQKDMALIEDFITNAYSYDQQAGSIIATAYISRFMNSDSAINKTFPSSYLVTLAGMVDQVAHSQLANTSEAYLSCCLELALLPGDAIHYKDTPIEQIHLELTM